jgi:hypothetical protein
MTDTRSLREQLGPMGYAVTFASVVGVCLALGVALSILRPTSRSAIRATAPISPAGIVLSK